jgi:hypothetical protein
MDNSHLVGGFDSFGLITQSAPATYYRRSSEDPANALFETTPRPSVVQGSYVPHHRPHKELSPNRTGVGMTVASNVQSIIGFSHSPGEDHAFTYAGLCFYYDHSCAQALVDLFGQSLS